MHNMTKKELAEKANISIYTLSAYENESRPPTLTSLNNIARVFGVDISCLINNTVRTPCYESIIINNAIEKMSPSDRIRLLKLAETHFPEEFGLSAETNSNDFIPVVEANTDNNMYCKTEICDAGSLIWNDILTSTFGKKFEKPLINAIRRTCCMLIKEAEEEASRQSRPDNIMKSDIYEARNILMKRQKTVYQNKTYEMALNNLIETTAARLIANLSDIDFRKKLAAKKKT